MQRDWTNDEKDWARKCLRAGDTLEQVSAWGGRPVAEIKRQLGLQSDDDMQVLYLDAALRWPVQQGRGA